MGQGPARGIDGKPFEIEGIEFVPHWARPSRPGSLTLLKAERMVEPYRRLFAAHPAPNVVELGISQGGSVALLALLARPRKLVALELSPTRIDALDVTLAQHGLAEVVRPVYGIDQGDRAAVRAIVDREFGTEPLDIVIDDASHLFGPTLASFELLFPRLRPGGLYVIEDWTWQDTMAARMGEAMTTGELEMTPERLALLAEHMVGEAPRVPPLSLLSLHLGLACAQSSVVAEVTMDEDWTLIRRGEGELPRDGFRLSDVFADHYRVFADDMNGLATT